MTNYRIGMLKIAECDTLERFHFLEREFYMQYVSDALTLDKWLKLDNRLSDLYNAWIGATKWDTFI